ncbi:DUF4382 domain-containing protein [Candidatus Woesearchaeota archaeon]|nr:DUF4382 domain-containing protein [Candidatus Woesearchaeota archaeon]
MKKLEMFIALLSMVLLLIAACAPQSQQSFQAGQQSAEKGRAVFAITDAAADMGTVTSVKITVDSVQVHSATKGWIEVSSTPKTYDLLELKAEGKHELLADFELDEGTYGQLRMDISNVVVTDANGQQEAKLPSGELKINGNLVVDANSTSTATFDFIADESLHITGNGKYIMAPVVQLETREDADANVKSGNEVEIKGGKIKTNVKVGMDAKGNVGAGLGIPADIEISIDAGSISIGQKISAKAAAKGNAIFTITDAAANMGSVTSLKITVDKVMVHSDAKGWVNVSATPQTFDLLELKARGTQALITSANLEPGVYNQIRLDVSQVMVADANGEQEAKLPSNELKIFGTLVVGANSTSTATFDFIADESLHITGNGKYIMAPVIKLETKENADVEIKADNTVDIKGGIVKTSVNVGMDENGNVGIGRKISKDAEVSIDGGKIKVKTKIVVGY